MSLTVCQAQQSCLDPLLLEPRPLMQTLAPSKQDLSFPWTQKLDKIPAPENQNNFPISKPFETKEKPIDGWNLIQSLTNISSYPCRQPSYEPEPVYVHPQVKRSTSSLSSRSLEMCTESLGSETGTDIDSGLDTFSDLFSERKLNTKPKTRESCKKIKQNKTFPPPLTSISGNDGVQVQTHREDGRLVIKAFSFSSCGTYFRAERENGRLRLSLLKDEYIDCDQEKEEEAVDQEENVDEENEECDHGVDEAEACNMKNGCIWGENRKDDGMSVGCKIGSGEWSSSRCNGDRSGGKRIPSLPFCVAIS